MTKLINALLYSNVFIALCSVTCYLYGKLFIFDQIQEKDLYVCLLVFFSTLLAYNITRRDSILDIEEGKPARIQWMQDHIKWFPYVNVVSAIISLICLFYINAQSIILLGVLGAISIGYTIPIGQFFGFHRKLREIGVFKIFLIALVWASICAILPITLYIDLVEVRPDMFSVVFIKDALRLFMQELLFIFSITLFFDIRDLETDKLAKIKTIPHYIGANVTLLISVTLLLLSYWFFELNLYLFVITVLILILSYKKKNDWWYLGLIDGTILLQFLLCWSL